MTLAIAAGGLPAGLTLNPSTGVLRGTPTTVGTTGFTVKVTNAWGTTTAAYTVAVTAGAPPKITTSAPPAPIVGRAYSYHVATTGTAPLTFAVASGTLPAGLKLDAATSVVSGTPTAAGARDVAIRATDPWRTATSAPLTFTVRAA